MHCMHCGNELEGNPRFCYICGQPVSQVSEPAQPAEPVSPPVSLPPPKPRRKRGRRRWLWLCGAVVLILILACGLVVGGAYLWLGLHRTNQTARIVPADTGALVTIHPSLLQLPQLRNADNLVEGMAVFAALPGVIQAGETLQENLPLDLDVDPQKDILPWIGGDVGLAILYENLQEVRTGYSIYTFPSMVVTAATRNQELSDRFLDRLRDQMEDQDIDLDRSVYQGVEITEIVSPASVPLAYATVNHLVVIATNGQVLRDAIDAAQGQGGPVLADQEAFKKTLRALPANRLGSIYLDWPAMLEYAGAEDVEQVPMGGLAGIENLGIAFSLTGDGLLFDYVAQYNLTDLSPAQQEALRQKGVKHRLTEIMPGNSLAYFSGQNLLLGWQVLDESSLWQEVAEVQEEIIHSIDPTAQIEETDLVTEIEQETGVHLVDDLLARMTGEYAVLVAPDPDGYMGDEEVPLGMVVAIQVKERAAVEDNVQLLLDAMTEAGIRPDRDVISGLQYWRLEDRYSDTLWSYGFVDDVLFFASSEEMVRLLAQAKAAPLAKADLFRRAVRPLPSGSRGTVYLDVAQSVRTLTRAMDDYDREEFEETVEPYIESIRAISMASKPMDEDGLLRGTLFVCTETP